jgi:hypothetical protein
LWPTHKVRIYEEYHSVCPLVGLGTLPTSLSPASVPLPQNRGGGGAHSPAGEGLGESQFRRLQKKLSTLPTLWANSIHCSAFFCQEKSLNTNSKLDGGSKKAFRELVAWKFIKKESNYLYRSASLSYFYCVSVEERVNPL